MRRHELSQHFLRSPRLALFLIGHSNIKKRDLVLDIGAGSGVITAALARRCREVWAVEPDHATAEKLRANLARQQIHNVKIIEQDFRSIDLPSEPYKVFSNPPFHLSAEILYKLFGFWNHDGRIEPLASNAGPINAVGSANSTRVGSACAADPAGSIGPASASGTAPTRSPDSVYLILQKQLALKLIPTERHYTSQLGSLIMQSYATKIRYPLRKTDFTPPPAVDTVLWEAKLLERNLGPNRTP